MIRFCKKTTCTELLIDSENKYCTEHTPINCIFPDCSKLAISHLGLCRKHYNYATNLVESGKITWNELKSKNKVREV